MGRLLIALAPYVSPLRTGTTEDVRRRVFLGINVSAGFGLCARSVENVIFGIGLHGNKVKLNFSLLIINTSFYAKCLKILFYSLTLFSE